MGDSADPKLIDRQALAVVALAIVVRLAWVALFARTPTGLSDPALYNDAANRLVAGEGYRSLLGEPTAYYPPGYPAVLSWIYRLADAIGLGAHRATVVGVIQSFWWGVSAGAVMLAGRWAAGARAGLAAGLVIALWPNLIAHAGAHLTESLFVMLVSVCIAALVWLANRGPLDRRDIPAVIVLALTIGPAVLIRPQVAAVVIAVFVAWLLARVDLRRIVAVVVVLAASCVLWAAPWVVRNQDVVGGATLISTNNGTNLCIGYNAEATGAFGQFAGCDTGERYVDGSDAELRIDVENRRRALDYIAAEPLSIPALTAQKFWATFGTDDDGLRANESFGAVEIMRPGVRSLWRAVTIGLYAAIMIAAVVGFALSLWRLRPLRERAAMLTILMTLATSLAVPLLVFGDPRFKVSFAPQIAVLAGIGCIAVINRVRPAART
jgi:4-amino-4-deoxy-L-arabinose transferase-like glycosyltransferase